ncbi:FecR family protein [Steroidobacter sp.]|uniref:FecR family protein n=1 Tax=Steroidobacter sp. TaxID=1978227 RepID=UPI001A5B0650|nr:FecR domain-containing protein [Steroidobacter sp.]MBL8268638.1 FecR domain-containing protein [Steroidobacter sp.]
MKDQPRTSTARAAAEAADWYARLRAQDVTEIEAMRFRAWIAADPVHRQEFETLDQFWDELGVLGDCPEVAQERRGRWWRSPRFSTPARLSAAAVMLIAIAAGWFVYATAGRYDTAYAEQRVVALPDGSTVTLHSNARIELHFTPERRGIELVRGQAHFDVAKDASRPFVVAAAGREVRALGTVFDVHRNADRVLVTLVEGKVAVTPSVTETGASAVAAPPIVLTPGEQLSYGAPTSSDVAAAAATATAANVTAGVTEWRERSLEFSDVLLTDAIAEANRYSRLQVVLDVPRLRDARISGRFEAGKIEMFVEGVCAYLDIDAQRVGEHRIVLRDRS